MPVVAFGIWSFTIARLAMRILYDDRKQRSRIRAAAHGHPMEEEARAILRQAMSEAAPPRDLAAAVRVRIATLGGVDLDGPAHDRH